MSKVICGDCLKVIPKFKDEIVYLIVTFLSSLKLLPQEEER